MLDGLRQRLDEWIYRPGLAWAQIDITTHCNARCRYCPTAVLGPAWPRRHMPLDTFRRLLPPLARSARRASWRRPFLHLQGWGEPLLNPDFFAMVAAAKAAGLRVATTSNAMLIDDDAAARLVGSGIDIVALSVAGIDRRNDAVRWGTRLEQVLAAVAALDRYKRALASPTPALHIAYLLMASGLDDAGRIPDAFAGRGVAQIVVSTLGYVADPSLFAEAILPRTAAEHAAVARRLDGAAARAAEHGMTLAYRIPPPPGGRPGRCAENVQSALVVTVDGQVTPCMFNRFAGDGDPRPAAAPFLFGDLTRQSLTEIWWSDAYVRFRNSFAEGHPPPRCLACSKLDRG